MTTNQKSNTEPTIGIITALPVEYVAVKVLLENQKELTVPGQGAGRRYVIGEIPSENDKHTIVLSLASMGRNAAAMLVTLLLNHFPTINVIIIVGIAGGIPYPEKPDEHVRLGDIVVSGQEGVAQYDFDSKADPGIIHRHSPRAPSATLLEAVRLLKVFEIEGKRPWLKYIDQVCQKLGVKRPPEETDILVSSSDPAKIISHPSDPQRTKGEPKIFIDSVASVSKLMKNHVRRDQLRDKFGVKAVEMEGSGIADEAWNHEAGYLIVRGIADYCDSAKSDQWHQYASVTAAAYTRALLESVPAPVTDTENRITRLIEYPSDEIRISDKESMTLPYCLKQFKIKNFQCIKEIAVENIPTDSRFVFLTGENGTGKTSVLQAIAIGLHGNEERKHKKIFCSDENTKIAAEIRRKDEEPIINNFLGKDNRYSEIRHFEYLAAYGPSRLELESESISDEELQTSPVFSLFETRSVFQNIQYWLKKRFYASINPDLPEKKRNREKEKIKNVTELMVRLMPHVTEIKMKTHDTDLALLYKENGFDVPFEYLAAGHKNILVMIGDLLIRLFDSQPWITNPGDLAGIILIDEFEAHLHPKWQKEFPRILSETFPNVQFIVSTHSVITFLGAPAGSTFLHVTRDTQTGTQIENLDIDVQNLLPNQILTSPIFGMENIQSIQNKGFENVRTEDSFQEIIKRDEVRNQLKKYTQNFKLPDSFPN